MRYSRFAPCVLALAALGAVSCGSNASKSKGSSAGGPDAGQIGIACTTDSDCASHVPTTTPPDCAVGKCNAVEGVCVFSAKDADGDGHAAANCTANDGTLIQTGDDCDDTDKKLYPGHPESCTSLPDGTPVAMGLCNPGHFTCQSDGTKSPCTDTGVCVTEPCATACTLGCQIFGSYYGANAINPADPCQSCQPKLSASAWSPDPATDGQKCANGNTCCGGVCDDVSSDVKNCGGCGHTCTAATGPACAFDRCEYTLVSGLGGTSPIAVDSTSVYLSTSSGSGGQVLKVPLAGGSPTTLASISSGNAGDIAVDSTSLYWTASNDVMKLPLAGGSPTTLVSGQVGIGPIAIDSTDVYWVIGGTAMKVPLGGGTPTTLASGQSGGEGVAVDSTSVYWTDYTFGNVVKAPLGGGTPTTLATGQDHPIPIAVDSTHVYWINEDTGGSASLVSLPLSGGTPTTLASGGWFTDLAVDSTNVYWTGDGKLMSVPLAGGTPSTLASSVQMSPAGLAVDSTSVYWTAPGSKVMRAAK